MATDLTLKFKVTDEGTVLLDKISQKIGAIDESAKKMGSSLSLIKLDSLINLGERAIQAGKGIYDLSRSVATAGNDIQRMSRNFNMGIEDFQKWSYVAKMADIEIEGFGQAFKFITKSMSEALQGTGDATKAFDILGIKLKDVNGNTKDQQTVMMETIGALEKYADGVNRDALMLAIFGRSWMSVKPLIDQGTEAIKSNRDEAERMNLILGKNVVDSLSQSEEAFKKWSFTLNVAKMETLAPLIEILGSMIERVLALKRAWAEGGIKGIYQDIIGAQEAAGIENLPAAGWTKEWAAGWKPPPPKKKPEAAELPGAKTEAEKRLEHESKAWGEIADLRIDELTALNQIEIDKAKDRINIEKYALDKMLEGEKEFKNESKEAWAYVYKVQSEEDENWTKMHEYAQQKILEGEQEFNEERIGAWEAVYNVMTEKELKKIKESEAIWQEFGNSLSSVWAENVSNMLKGTETFADGFKNLIQGVANSFISAVSKMIVNWILFKNVQGTYKSGVGLLGIVGSMLGMQHGGSFWANRPTPLLVGEGGQREFVSVTPENKMGNGREKSNITAFYIYANDPISFREFVRRNPQSIIELINEDARSAGTMRKDR
jgi:hypothetical protein